MGRCLVTGANGFIGSSILSNINSSDHIFIGLSSSILAPSIINCDLFDKEKLRQALINVDCIIHCAGYVSADRMETNKEVEKHWHINYEGSKNLLDIACDLGVKQFINLSSVKVMGKVGESCVNESYSGEPITSYAKSKLAFEQILARYSAEEKISTVNLRLSMVYGRGSKGNLTKMIAAVKSGFFPPIPETWNHRSLIHIDDVVRAVKLVLFNSKANGSSYILTGPTSPSGRQLYNSIRAALNLPPIDFCLPATLLWSIGWLCEMLQYLFLKKLPFNLDVLDRLLRSEWYSSKKIEDELGWIAEVNLDEGLKSL